MSGGVIIGASAGGLKALAVVLSGLPCGFSMPVVVAQHRAESSGEALVEALGAATPLRVKEAEDKERLEPGTVYLAPAGYHLYVESRVSLALSCDPPVCYSRPSIDLLLSSASDAFGPELIGVILTGANADGTAGLLRARERGAITIAQDPREATAPEMPEAAILAGAIDSVLPLSGIAALLVDLARARPGGRG